MWRTDHILRYSFAASYSSGYDARPKRVTSCRTRVRVFMYSRNPRSQTRLDAVDPSPLESENPVDLRRIGAASLGVAAAEKELRDAVAAGTGIRAQLGCDRAGARGDAPGPQQRFGAA